MLTRWRLGTPARLSWLFVGVAGTLLAALGWLWLSLLAAEEREAERQASERLRDAASDIGREIDRALDRWEAAAVGALTSSAPAPADTAVVLFDAEGVLQTSGAPLPFVPAVRATPAVDHPQLELARARQFDDLPGAARFYRQAAASRDAAVRAAALVGLAHVERRRGRASAAASAYTDLLALGDRELDGFPTRLIAHAERAAVLEADGDDEAARLDRDALETALLTGATAIDRSTFDTFAPMLPRALSGRQTALADALMALWSQLERSSEGRGGVIVDGRAFAAAWTSSGGQSGATLGPLDTLLLTALPPDDERGVGVAIVDHAGTRVWGEHGTGGATSFALGELGLPWLLSLTAYSQTNPDAILSRRTLITLGFGLMALVIAVASYAVFRSVNRELGVARLQSDFVAAVSHEFRSPLTAMRHLTDVLEEGAASPGQLPKYYEALGRETRRLHGLVEHLLDFGRMQTGRREYRFEADDAVDLARAVVEEYRPHAAASGHELTFEVCDGAAPVRADRDALSLALRNLVDNAAKYAPAGTPVAVTVAPNGSRVSIGVHNGGAGIPPDEQRRIFDQFVRGSAAAAGHVKGTGIGLTMADRIVRAHGGRIEVASSPGAGSTFRIWLPVT